MVLFQKGIYLVTPVILRGHCKARMELQIQGTLLASKEFKYSVGIDHWILFQYVDNLVISGGGSLDGQGASSWPYNDCLKNSRCKALPGVSCCTRFYSIYNFIPYLFRSSTCESELKNSL